LVRSPHVMKNLTLDRHIVELQQIHLGIELNSIKHQVSRFSKRLYIWSESNLATWQVTREHIQMNRH